MTTTKTTTNGTGMNKIAFAGPIEKSRFTKFATDGGDVFHIESGPVHGSHDLVSSLCGRTILEESDVLEVRTEEAHEVSVKACRNCVKSWNKNPRNAIGYDTIKGEELKALLVKQWLAYNNSCGAAAKAIADTQNEAYSVRIIRLHADDDGGARRESCEYTEAEIARAAARKLEAARYAMSKARHALNIINVVASDSIPSFQWSQLDHLGSAVREAEVFFVGIGGRR